MRIDMQLSQIFINSAKEKKAACNINNVNYVMTYDFKYGFKKITSDTTHTRVGTFSLFFLKNAKIKQVRDVPRETQ